MEAYEIDHNVFSDTESEADKTLLVRFYTKSVQDQDKTITEGRPIFREKTYIEIRYPGNRTDSIARPATAHDIQRFPRHYKAFKDRVELPEEGTPLNEWPVISRSQAEELSFFNIKTVEQLAAVSDAEGHKFMGFNNLKSKAKEFLESSRDIVESAQLREELHQRDEVIRAMQEQIDMLIKQAQPKKEEQPDLFDAAEPIEESASVTPRRKRRPLKEE